VKYFSKDIQNCDKFDHEKRAIEKACHELFPSSFPDSEIDTRVYFHGATVKDSPLTLVAEIFVSVKTDAIRSNNVWLHINAYGSAASIYTDICNQLKFLIENT
jgi:hypothetical protein